MTIKNEACPMIVSKIVTTNIICMIKLIPNPCHLQGKEAKSKTSLALVPETTSLCKGPKS